MRLTLFHRLLPCRNRAFHADEVESQTESKRDATNRKATIVIEHLIQASDVAHTMQHWVSVSLSQQMQSFLFDKSNCCLSELVSMYTASGTNASSWSAMLRTKVVERKLTPV